MKTSLRLLAAIATLVGTPTLAKAETWNLAIGGTWNDAASWNPASIPNAIGASVTFNGAATGSNPDQTANRSITLDGQKTVGSILFNNDLGSFTNSITTGTGSPPNLVFNAGGSGATITTMGSGTGNNTFTASFKMDDNVTAFVNNTVATSAAGSLNITGVVTGTGSFTKEGVGLATFGTNSKTFTGAMNINNGRMRISNAAQPSAVSSFTINSGGQLTLISAGTYTFGSGPLNLNGSGPTGGPYAAFPGAIRPDRGAGLTYTIANATNLNSDTVIHMQASTGTSANPSESITFSGTMTGGGKLIFTANNSDIDQGILNLSGANNSFSGGTLVQGGIVKGSSTSAFGNGAVTVSNALSPSSIARIDIIGTDVIKDTATLNLAGGGAAGAADQNFAILESGINETVGGLVLGGVAQTIAGTYGSTSSGATFQNDEYFTGTGTITLALAGLPGDFNSDGKVDAGDYVTWRKNDGTNNALANDNGLGVPIGASHYNLWRANFGKPPGSGSGLTNSAVPEPSTIALAGLCEAPLLIRRRRRFGKVQ